MHQLRKPSHTDLSLREVESGLGKCDASTKNARQGNLSLVQQWTSLVLGLSWVVVFMDGGVRWRIAVP